MFCLAIDTTNSRWVSLQARNGDRCIAIDTGAVYAIVHTLEGALKIFQFMLVLRQHGKVDFSQHLAQGFFLFVVDLAGQRDGTAAAFLD